MPGINETTQVLAFIETLGVALGKEISGDGLDLWDAFKVFDDPEFREKLGEAIEGITLVPSEIQDIDIVEGFTLSKKALDVAQNILTAFRGGETDEAA